MAKRLKRSTIYYAIRALVWLFNALHRRAAQSVGAWIGLLVWRLSGKDRYRVNKNLTLVYGNRLTSIEKSTICREFFINSGKNIADVLRFKRYFASEIRDLITIEGMEHWLEPFERGHGVVAITGHIGNFELLGAYLQTLGHPIAVIARELHDHRLDRILTENRRAVGLTNFATTKSPRHTLRWLKNNGAVGALIDTDSTRVRGEFIPMFGMPAFTPIGQSLLGLRANAAFVPTACVRTDNNRYHIIVRPEVQIEKTGDFETDAIRITRACVAELEKIIDAHKSQWIWIHNRWNTQPEYSA